MHLSANLIGQQFGVLTVKARAYSTRAGTYWLCQCAVCGKDRQVRQDHLRHCEWKSCGCVSNRHGRKSATTPIVSKKLTPTDLGGISPDDLVEVDPPDFQD